MIAAYYEPLELFEGEIVSVGADFATIPLEDGETLVETSGDDIAEVYVLGNDNQRDPDAVVVAASIDGTSVTAKIKAAKGHAVLFFWAPTSNGHYYGARRHLSVRSA